MFGSILNKIVLVFKLSKHHHQSWEYGRPESIKSRDIGNVKIKHQSKCNEEGRKPKEELYQKKHDPSEKENVDTRAWKTSKSYSQLQPAKKYSIDSKLEGQICVDEHEDQAK